MREDVRRDRGDAGVGRLVDRPSRVNVGLGASLVQKIIDLSVVEMRPLWYKCGGMLQHPTAQLFAGTWIMDVDFAAGTQDRG